MLCIINQVEAVNIYFRSQPTSVNSSKKGLIFFSDRTSCDRLGVACNNIMNTNF